MTQPPVYPNQPGDPYGAPGQPPQAPPPGQGWPGYQQPQDPYQQPQDPYAQPTSSPPTSGQPYVPPPTSSPPTSGQPYLPPGQYQQPGYPGQPPTTSQPYVQPGPAYPPTSGQPFSPAPGQTSSFPADPYGTTGFQPGFPVAPPPKKKRGLTITLIVLAVVLVLCGGGGAAAYFVVQNNTGTGQKSAIDAVKGFLKAVYQDKNVEEAQKFVCASARNKENLTKRIEDIRTYDTKLKDPTYSWPEPTVEKENKESATLLVPVKVQTSDDKVAEQKLRILATNDNGWWVCEIATA